MKDYYAILGVPRNASQDDIKAAYRRLASQYHPDKLISKSESDKAEGEAKFKEASEAYEILSDTNKKNQYDNPRSRGSYSTGGGWGGPFSQNQLDEIIRQMRQQAGSFSRTLEINTRIPIKEAVDGAEMTFQVNGKKEVLKIPKGIPDGARIQIKTESGIDVIANISLVCEDGYVVVSAQNAKYQVDSSSGERTGVIETGAVETNVQVEAIDILTGSWIEVRDIVGKTYSVRLPSGFDIKQRLRVKGAGYYNWVVDKFEASKNRADMFIKIKPIFKSLKETDITKIDILHTLAHKIHDEQAK